MDGFVRQAIRAAGEVLLFTLIQGTALVQLNQSPGHVPGTQCRRCRTGT